MKKVIRIERKRKKVLITCNTNGLNMKGKVEREMGWLSGNFPTSGSSPQISRKMAQRKTKRDLTAADISDLSNNCHFLLRALSLLSLSAFLNRLTSWKITEPFGLSPQPPVWTLYNT